MNFDLYILSSIDLTKNNNIFFCSPKSIDNLNSNPMGIITPFCILTWSFAIIACICECGERVAEQFFDFNDKLNQCKWYSFPLDVQRILLIFMGDAQQPTFIRGYANILCTRNSFKEVRTLVMDFSIKNHFDPFHMIFIHFIFIIQTVHGGFSYFMLIRQIDA